MSELDKAAMLDATEQFMASVVGSGFDCDALEAAITAYRQAECKPFKDAPRDGTAIQAWDTKTEWWRNIRFCEVGHNQYWGSMEQSNLVWGEGNALSTFTHYRIPFNPEEG